MKPPEEASVYRRSSRRNTVSEFDLRKHRILMNGMLNIAYSVLFMILLYLETPAF